MKYIAFLEDGISGEIEDEDFTEFGEVMTVTIRDKNGNPVKVQGRVGAIAACRTAEPEPWIFIA
jgi:hypothetical protein